MLFDTILNNLESKAPVKGPDSKGNYLTSCPFHEDNRPSFSLHSEKGFKCFAGSCGIKGSIRKLAELLDIKTGPLTIADISQERLLPIEWLSKLCNNGKKGVEITYSDINNEKGPIRLRNNLTKNKKDGRFRWIINNDNIKLIPYGLWLLKEQQTTKNYTILVEGESDCWTLWYNGFCSIGIPGVETWKPNWINYFKDFGKIYLWLENDDGGRRFLLNIFNDMPDVYVIQAPKDIKDASALYLTEQDNFQNLVYQAMAEARPAAVVIDELKQIYDMLWTGQLNSWYWDEDGLHKKTKEGIPYQALSLKLYPKEMLLTTDNRKTIKIMISTTDQIHEVYLNDSWVGARSTEASSELAQYGIALTAKQVSVLQEFVADLMNKSTLPTKIAYRNLGWYENNLFVPGLNNAMYIPESGMNWVSYYGKKSDQSEEKSLEAWQYILERACDDAPVIMVVIGAALAAPYLYFLPDTEIINFMIHIHTPGTGTGKTTLLELAAACMGDPRKIRISWNSTKVSQEIMLGTLKNLPLFVNELADAKDYIPEDVVMMLTEGTGRRRGTSSLGLRRPNDWRTLILSTGNKSISQGVAHVARRVLAIPITLPDEKLALECQEISRTSYGYPLWWCKDLYMQHKDKIWLEIKRLSKCYNELYQNDLAPLKPQAPLWATVEVGARMMLSKFNMDEHKAHEQILNVAAESAKRRQAEGINYVTNVLDLIKEDIAKDPASYGIYKYGNQRPMKGRSGKVIDYDNNGEIQYLAIMPSKLKELCFRASIQDLTGVLIEARDKNVLMVDSDRKRLTRKVSIDNCKTRCHIFNLTDNECIDEDGEMIINGDDVGTVGTHVGTYVGTKIEARCFCIERKNIYVPTVPT